MNLMIVEDNEQMRRLIRNFVERMADQICECSDGAAAVAAYALHRPDWVLMDVEMKGMDGITATRKIREIFADANIIIVTQYDDASTRAAAQEAGACGYVLKENLLALRELISQSQTTKETEL
jgi:CheY-like chemotaxis protein